MTMGNYNRDERGGGGRSFGRRDFGRRDFGGGRGFGSRGDRPMFKAICSNCGKECEVPFRPTGAKPVFCSECFEKRSREAGHTNFPRDSRGGGASQSVDLSAVNAKLDKILAMLESKNQVSIIQTEQSGGSELVERTEKSEVKEESSEKPKKKVAKKKKA